MNLKNIRFSYDKVCSKKQIYMVNKELKNTHFEYVIKIKINF